MPVSTARKGTTFIPTDFYETFVEGQTVRLITGSVPMVVIDVCPDCGDVTVAYGTSDGDIDVLELPPAAIELAD